MEDLEALKEESQHRSKLPSSLLSSVRGALGVHLDSTPVGEGFSNASEGAKSEWLRVNNLIMEANEIGKNLEQGTVFSRIDSITDGGEARIQLHNLRLNIVTTWSLEKFEERLEQMRQLYHIASNLDESELSEEGEAGHNAAAAALFYDPDDDWIQQVVVLCC